MKAKTEKRSVEDLLTDLIIIQLGLARVPQHQIREIAGVDMNRVNQIVRRLRVRQREE